MNPPDKSRLLQQIAAIPAMERGKLSDYSFKERPGASGPYHKLQHWREGKNHTRYVSAQELPAVQAALAGYAQYRQLTEQYADLVIEETRQQIAGSKKKKFHRTSSCPKTKKSNAPEGTACAESEVLLRTAVYKSVNDLVGWLLQQAADRIDAAYQPKPGEV